MKFILIAVTLMLSITALPPKANADQFRGSKICVYSDYNYRGQNFCVLPGTNVKDLSLTGWKNRIASIRVFGSGRIILFDGINSTGQSATIWGNYPDLRKKGFVNRAASFLTYSNGDAACFFEDAEYSGEGSCFPANYDVPFIGDWAPLHNDRVSSIRLDGNTSTYIYLDANFASRMVWVQHSVYNLATDLPGWNDQISSMRIRHFNGQ